MLKPSYTKQFDKDLKRILRSGKDKKKIKKIIGMLINQGSWIRNLKIIN